MQTIFDIFPFDFLKNNNLSAINIDLLYCKVLGNCSIETKPFVEIELENINQLSYMLKEADNIHIYGENSVFHFIAFYKNIDIFPIARAYYIKTSNLIELSKIYKFNNLDISSIRIYNHNDYFDNFLVQEGDFKKRLDNYFRKKKDNFKNKLAFELFEGRKKNTVVDFGYRINTENCLICGNSSSYTVSSTLVIETGKSFSYDVCSECYKDMNLKDISPLNYLSNHCLGVEFLPVEPLSREEILQDTKDYLKQELNCSILDVRKDEIIALRKKSNIKIIFRLSEPLDYGYMFFEPCGKKQFARIDSSNHHPELKFQPDHIHDSQHKKDFNKKVKESFTTGIPIIDKDLILDILIKKELELEKSDS